MQMFVFDFVAGTKDEGAASLSRQDSDRGRLYLRQHNTVPGIPFVRSVWRTIDSEEMKARPPQSFVPVKRQPLVRRD